MLLEDFFMEKKEHFYRTHPILFSLLVSEVIGIVIGMADVYTSFGIKKLSFSFFATGVMMGLLTGTFCVVPVILTIQEAALLWMEKKQKKIRRLLMAELDLLVLTLGVFYESCYAVAAKQIELFADWDVQLANSAMHAAIYTKSLPTLLAISILALAGYIFLMCTSLERTPPLTVVLSISAMYLGTLEPILFAVQIFDWKEPLDFYLWLLPVNCILVITRIVMQKVREWGTISMEKYKIQENPFLRACDNLLDRATLWPVLAFLLMFPLLGVLIMILLLFGQAPDAVIKAWTETSDWKLSMREAPQNIYYDEHYLCTVAAGGHRNVVKPIRKGIRHGHAVIVNRQLCIANAFEQVLEERTPRFHQAVRHFYDTYGFPVARLIKSRYVADLVYFLMKPLEWIFLIVLYLVDVHPENRIAVQYMGR